MMRMIYCDFYTMKQSLLQSLAVLIIVAMFISFFVGSSVAAAIIAATTPILYSFMLSAVDMTAGWESFRLTMPIRRQNIVVGRYVSILIVVIIAIIIATACGLLANAIQTVLPLGISEQINTEDFGANTFPSIMLSACAASSMAIIMNAASLPFMLKFGLTKGVRWIPALLAILFLFSNWLFGESGPFPNTIPTFFTLFSQSSIASQAIAFILLAAFVLAVYVISAFISIRLYKTKDF